MNWTFHITEHWEEIWNEDYQKKWLDLLNASPNSHVFFHPSLVKAWVETYIPLRKISPVFIWGEYGNNKVFFPLILWHKNWKNAFLKVIVPAGYSDFDYHDPIFREIPDEKSITQFWNDLVIILGRYKYDKIILDGLHEEYIHTNNFKTISYEPCPFLSLSNFRTLEEFRSCLKTKLRQDINRRIRKLDEAGSVEYIIYDKGDLSRAVKVLPDMLRIHAQRWPNAYKAPDFHKNLIIHGINSGLVHFSQINLDGVPISWRIGFIFKDCYYSYMPTINPDYQRFSPGKLHLVFCIGQAIEKNLKTYDQLRGSELYKSEWTDRFCNIYNIECNSPHISSTIKNSLIHIKSYIEHLKK